MNRPIFLTTICYMYTCFLCRLGKVISSIFTILFVTFSVSWTVFFFLSYCTCNFLRQVKLSHVQTVVEMVPVTWIQFVITDAYSGFILQLVHKAAVNAGAMVVVTDCPDSVTGEVVYPDILVLYAHNLVFQIAEETEAVNFKRQIVFKDVNQDLREPGVNSSLRVPVLLVEIHAKQ